MNWLAIQAGMIIALVISHFFQEFTISKQEADIKWLIQNQRDITDVLKQHRNLMDGQIKFNDIVIRKFGGH